MTFCNIINPKEQLILCQLFFFCLKIQKKRAAHLCSPFPEVKNMKND